MVLADSARSSPARQRPRGRVLLQPHLAVRPALLQPGFVVELVVGTWRLAQVHASPDRVLATLRGGTNRRDLARIAEGCLAGGVPLEQRDTLPTAHLAVVAAVALGPRRRGLQAPPRGVVAAPHAGGTYAAGFRARSPVTLGLLLQQGDALAPAHLAVLAADRVRSTCAGRVLATPAAFGLLLEHRDALTPGHWRRRLRFKSCSRSNALPATTHRVSLVGHDAFAWAIARSGGAVVDTSGVAAPAALQQGDALASAHGGDSGLGGEVVWGHTSVMPGPCRLSRGRSGPRRSLRRRRRGGGGGSSAGVGRRAATQRTGRLDWRRRPAVERTRRVVSNHRCVGRGHSFDWTAAVRKAPECAIRRQRHGFYGLLPARRRLLRPRAHVRSCMGPGRCGFHKGLRGNGDAAGTRGPLQALKLMHLVCLRNVAHAQDALSAWGAIHAQRELGFHDRVVL
mmetsp:Transcript_85596/g.239023  ORF Transcript_85596/g.239023 Transcript_85596/m.239023 type:complete len:453 (-) Transcript_85596:355-1713(-)